MKENWKDLKWMVTLGHSQTSGLSIYMNSGPIDSEYNTREATDWRMGKNHEGIHIIGITL